MLSIDKVKDRVRKLLNLAHDDAAAEGEIDNALRFAKQLMDEHHLSEDDLSQEPEDQYKQIENSPKCSQFVSVSGRIYAWESGLSMFCARFVGGVGTYIDSRKTPARDHRGMAILHPRTNEPYAARRICFYGIAEDVALAAELFHELRLSIIASAILKFGGYCKGDGGYYCEGFVAGLREKTRKAEEQSKPLASDSKALVLVDRRKDLIERKKDAGNEWLKSQGIKLCSGSHRSGASGSSDSFHEGRSDGRSTDVSVSRTKKLACN